MNLAGNKEDHIEKSTLPDMNEAEALCNDLKHILVRSGDALTQGDAKENIEKVERWVESYRRGLSAAQKISDNGTEILQRVRSQLSHSLNELIRLEDEGGNPAPAGEHASVSERDEITRAIKRIDSLLPVVERSFQATHSEPEKV